MSFDNASFNDERAEQCKCGGTITQRYIYDEDPHGDPPEPTNEWECDTCSFRATLDSIPD